MRNLLRGGSIVNKRAFRVLQPVLRWLSTAILLAFAAQAHAVVVSFDTHWDGDWNTTTGIINGTFFVETLPFPMLSVVSDTNTNVADWFGTGGDSLHFTFTPGPAQPPFGGFTQFGGSFQIVSGTGNYAGATGLGTYIGFYIADPGDPNIRKISVFDNGTINIVPEPTTNALLLAGVGALAMTLRARRKKS